MRRSFHISFMLLIIAGCFPRYPFLHAETTLRRDSPIAFDDHDTIYGIADDSRSIISSSVTLGNFRSWRNLGVSEIPTARIAGLTYANGALYVSSVEPSGVFRVDLKSGEIRPVYLGPPFVEPADIAVVDGVLFVSDNGVATVFRLLAFGGRPEPLFPKSLASVAAPPFYLAGWDDGLIISSPGDGTVTQIDRSQLFAPSNFSVVQQSTEWALKNPSASNQTSQTRDVTSSRYPDIRRPGPVSICRGVVYVINEDDHQIYAFSRYNGRAVRIEHSSALATDPRRLLVTDDRMYVVDATGIVSWPRLIPVEVALERDRTDATIAFFKYLSSRKLLPTRSVTIRDGINATLLREHVLLGEGSPQVDDFICELNEAACNMQKRPLALLDGQVITIPDFSSESYIDIRNVSLHGAKSLGEEADGKIFSSDLKSWLSEEKLSQFNEKLKSGSCNCVRGAKQGDARLPVEMVRYSIALPVNDVVSGSGGQESSELLSLGREYGLRITSAEEVRANPFGIVRQPHQQETRSGDLANTSQPDWDPLKADFSKLIQTIHYYHPAMQAPRIPVIGIAEDIDCGSPDFDADTCQKISEETYPVEASASVPRVGSNYTVRPYEPADHGTAVAALVAARRSAFESKGIDPEAIIVPMRAAEPAIGDDVRSAYVNYNVKIFNFSFNFPPGFDPVSLRTYVDDASESAYKDALFVVAAGNEGKQACSAASVYPVCWGQQPNVLVVGATDLNGTALTTGATGSNWSEVFVHVSAPGEGFHSSGRNRSYVPVAGTSFAAPLVTATAGLLYAENITDPWIIKQRIIATSDRNSNLKGKVMGGVLNVKRAVSFPTRAVITRVDDTESKIYIVPGAQNILFSTATAPTVAVPLRSIRRLISNGDGTFAIFYADPSNVKLLKIAESAHFPNEKASQFQYMDLGDALAPTGIKKRANLADLLDYVGPIAQ